ncbi:MAG TPA: DUF1127 domain-containing protein [bacterium]|jgi:uncharacterized protein YjiS (DUF1127 family)
MSSEFQSDQIAMQRLPLELELARLEARQLSRVALLALWLLAVRMARTLRRWRARSRQRAALADLNDHLLRDIGLDPARRRAECRKWFWRA